MKCDFKQSIIKAAHNGMPVVRLVYGSYEADICTDMGANCIRFSRNGMNVLRTPPDLDTFHSQPNVYGMPLLFPPNRIQGGVFTFQGRVYRFPINEPARGHHIHGFLSSTPFLLTKSSIESDGVRSEFSVSFHEQSPYLSFPHAFSISISYHLSASGLMQTLALQNNSQQDMPAGLGFHTTFQLPFVPNTAGEDYRLKAFVCEQICLDSNSIIPTGETPKDSAAGQALREGRLIPAGSPLSHHFGGRTGEIALTHAPTGAAVHYIPDKSFSFLMLWNGGGNSGFVCPEPQTWQVDAPNSPLPALRSGFQALSPGDNWCLTNRLFIDSGSL